MNITDRIAAAKVAYDEAMNLGAMQSDAFSAAFNAAIESLQRENDDLRAIISSCAGALRTGAFISSMCTIEFMKQLPAEISSTVQTLREQSPAPTLAKEWRCFHCDEVFATENGARLHFGMDQCSDPACKIKMGAEKSLLVALRRAETELQDAWAAIHNENTEAAKAYYAQQSRHGEQLRAAEELGFERGIKDSTAQIAALEEQALKDRKLRDEAQHDALLWQHSVAAGDHPSLLVTVWRQRREAFARAEAAEAEVKRLREALKPFGRAITYCEQLRKHGGDDSVRAHDFVISDEFRAARQALASTGGEHHAE